MLARTIKLDRLKHHPWYLLAPKTFFLVPISILSTIGNPKPSLKTDAGEGKRNTHTTDEVWKDIKHNGMRDPLVVLFGKSPDRPLTIRLESGNHRLQVAQNDGITHLPCIGMVQSQPYLNSGNGLHTTTIEDHLLVKTYVSMGAEGNLYEPYPHPIDLEQFFAGKNIIQMEKAEFHQTGDFLEFSL